MEIRVVLRGAMSGLLAGILGFIFAKTFAETYINKAIAYESGRDAVIAAVAKSQGIAIAEDGPEYFSRTVQSTWGLASGILALSTAMGALIAVAYLVLHGRFAMRPHTLVLLVTGLGFLAVYLVPFAKYPANPPAIGHTFTIATRTALYLTLVGFSVLFACLAAYLGRRLQGRFGTFNAALIGAAAFIVAIGIVMAVLPPLGHLAANKRVADSLGYGHSATETPLPVTNAKGQIVYPGFPADVLWKFRFYSILAQMIVWSATGLILRTLVGRLFNPRASRTVRHEAVVI